MTSNFSIATVNRSVSCPQRNFTAIRPLNLTVLSEEVWCEFGSQLVAWMVCNIVIWLVGVLLNFTLLCTLVRELIGQTRHSGSRILILHQISLDFLQVCAAPAMGVFTAYYMPGTSLRPMNPTECAFARVPFLWLECVSHWNTFATAVNRFVAVCFPMRYKRISSPKFVALFMVIPWLIGGLLSVPYLDHFSGNFIAAPKWFRCSFTDPTRFSVSAFLYFGFIMPMLMVTVLYTVTCLKMTLGQPQTRYGDVRVPENPNQSVARRLRKRFKIAKLLFVSAVCYDVLYLMNPVLTWLAPKLLDASPLNRMWLRQAYNLGFFVTPIVFFSMNPMYRTELAGMLKKISDEFSLRLFSIRPKSVIALGTASKSNSVRPSKDSAGGAAVGCQVPRIIADASFPTLN
ncbi:hypothetical protein BV898_15212 [Hypsibius exemplaris]|uniref:G-protein coupled receptors family 1 profile domain-containing protein n=1 Tax=Hypsibius exemplaris TaxID=2072580 RepID=A0A9X6RK08_HYPEX|nr:hypothetical protein BV898_15212 [Hypsibius exemplaris]